MLMRKIKLRSKKLMLVERETLWNNTPEWAREGGI